MADHRGRKTISKELVLRLHIFKCDLYTFTGYEARKQGSGSKTLPGNGGTVKLYRRELDIDRHKVTLA